jgi:hypothetical protein
LTEANCSRTHFGTDTSVSILVEGWNRNFLTSSTVDCIENDTPLGDIDSRVVEEVIKENLGTSVIPNREQFRGELTSLNSKPLLS